MRLTPEELQKLIKEELADMERRAFATVEGKKDPKAKARNRDAVVFPAESDKVKDNKDHFPINTAAQARTVLTRASQYKKVPKWYDGSLSSLVKEVQSKVKSKYPNIRTAKKTTKQGKQ